MIRILPPVVLFVFNRLDKVERCLSALHRQTVRPQKLIIFSDAARNKEEELAVQTVRDLVRMIDWAETNIIERPSNLGCARNIALGLTEVFKSHERAVIIEDDILPGNHFYESMSILLSEYADQKKIFSVGGFPSLKKGALSRYPHDVIFSPRFSCWGWGTWADRWQEVADKIIPFVNPYGTWEMVPLDVGRDLREGAQILEHQPLYSWAYPVSIWCMHRELVHAHSRHYLVSNIGTDGTGQNAFGTAYSRYMSKHVIIQDCVPERTPPYEKTDLNVRQAVRIYIEGSFSVGGARLKGGIVRLLRKLGLRS